MASDKRFQDVKKYLAKAGYTLVRINGSHHIFTKSGSQNIVIPVHNGKVKNCYVKQIEKAGK